MANFPKNIIDIYVFLKLPYGQVLTRFGHLLLRFAAALKLAIVKGELGHRGKFSKSFSPKGFVRSWPSHPMYQRHWPTSTTAT